MSQLSRTVFNTYPLEPVYGLTYDMMESEQSNWTVYLSKKLIQIKKKNEMTPLIYNLSCSGNGLLQIISSFCDYKMFLELICTSRLLTEIIGNYINFNNVYDMITRITNLEQFFKRFPYALACNYSTNIINIYYYREQLQPTLFIGKNLHTLDLTAQNLIELSPENFKGVKKLILNYCTGVRNELFTQVQGIEHLELENIRYPNIGSEAFAYFVRIKYLSIANSLIGTDGLEFDQFQNIAFSFLQGIESFKMTEINIMPGSLPYLFGIKQLSINNSFGITDIDIDMITRPGSLQQLSMNYCRTTITTASHPALKMIPDLQMFGCDGNTEMCPICKHDRMIDSIQEHLENECDIVCSLCNKNYMIGYDAIHLKVECAKNFIKCPDCNLDIIKKNESRHRKRCMMRLITCTLCNDKTPFHKKDLCAHINISTNYEMHEVYMCKFIRNMTEKLKYLQEEVDTLKEDVGHMDIIATQRQETLMFLMQKNVGLKRGKYMKQLSIQCNMMRQLFQIRQKQMKTLQNEIINKDMQEENSRYDDYYDDRRHEERLERWERRYRD